MFLDLCSIVRAQPNMSKNVLEMVMALTNICNMFEFDKSILIQLQQSCTNHGVVKKLIRTCAAWDYSAWVRTYALFLEERLECCRVLKYDVEAERTSVRFCLLMMDDFA